MATMRRSTGSSTEGGGGSSYRPKPCLRVISGPGLPIGVTNRARLDWNGTSRQLWPAWSNLDHWEDSAADQFGMELGAHLLVLWALRTFGGGTPALLEELVGDDAQPRFGDELLEDVARVAFSLGAAWSASILPSFGDPR